MRVELISHTTDAAPAKHAACKESEGIWLDIQDLFAVCVEQKVRNYSSRVTVAKATSAPSTKNALLLVKTPKVA